MVTLNIKKHEKHEKFFVELIHIVSIQRFFFNTNFHELIKNFNEMDIN